MSINHEINLKVKFKLEVFIRDKKYFIQTYSFYFQRFILEVKISECIEKMFIFYTFEDNKHFEF